MKLIIGLGNPGREYSHTRHNIGQQVVDKLISQKQLILENYPKLSARLSELRIPDRILLGITTEYMNNSGLAVKKIMDYFKIDPTDVYIIHDDLDLGVGEYKLQFDRGPAGHNGIKSIIQHLNTQAFHRLRIGIGHPRNTAQANLPVEDYVLLPFLSDELQQISHTIDKIVADFDNIIVPQQGL